MRSKKEISQLLSECLSEYFIPDLSQIILGYLSDKEYYIKRWQHDKGGQLFFTKSGEIGILRNHGISFLTQEGKRLQGFEGLRDVENEIIRPSDVSVFPNGNLLLIDPNSKKLHILTLSSLLKVREIKTLKGSTPKEAIATDKYIILSDDKNYLRVITHEGEQVKKWKMSRQVMTMCFVPPDELAIQKLGSRTVKIFSLREGQIGKLLGKWKKKDRYCSKISALPTGEIITYSNGDVQIFTRDGFLLRTLDYITFIHPQDLTTSPIGNLAILDDHYIYLFHYDSDVITGKEIFPQNPIRREKVSEYGVQITYILPKDYIPFPKD